MRLLPALAVVALLTACGGEQFEAEREAAFQQAKAQAQAAAAQTPDPGEVVDALPELDLSDLGPTHPDPIDLPQFAVRKDLMKAMGAASRNVGSSNIDEAREAAARIGEYSLAARHPRFEPQGPEYEAFAIALWTANQQVQLALAPEGDRSILQQALRVQRDSCQTCHRVYRIEE